VGAIALDADGAVQISDGGNAITVDGTVTATPSGTQDVDVTANTIGLATSANQLPDGHNVTVDNAAGASAVNIQDGGNSITVDGSVTIGTELPAGTQNIGDVDIATIAAGDNNIGNVDIASAIPAGDNNIGNVDIVSGTVTTVTTLTGGGVAHDSADSGNPHKFGGRAQSSEAQPEEVADNDRVDALFDRNGYLRVRGDFDPSFADINDSTSGNNTIVAAAGAGKRIAVWSILIVSDGTVDVRWEDGAAGTAFTGQVPLQAREGYTWTAGGIVPLFVGSANTLLNLELSAAVNVHGGVSYTVIDD
jgi:hypothetical protein